MLKEHPEAQRHHTQEWVTRVALGVLGEEPSRGYELMEQLEEFGFHQGELGAAMLYRTLRRLEREGLCKTEWEIPSEGGLARRRRMYSVTQAGEEYLRVLVDGSLWGRDYGPPCPSGKRERKR